MPKPSKIICAGLNYKDHAKEMGLPIPASPVIFLKPPTTLICDGESIIYPTKFTKELHYEAELAVVIAKDLYKVSEKEAKAGILGYTCANDVTARDLQKIDGQWTRAKSFNTFCPVSSKIVKDIDVSDLAIKLYLNGEIKQDSRTSQMIFSPAFIISFVSQIMPIFAGDIVITGTPPGIGPMNIGDEVVVEIEGIGRLVNRVIADE